MKVWARYAGDCPRRRARGRHRATGGGPWRAVHRSRDDGRHALLRDTDRWPDPADWEIEDPGRTS